MNFFDYQDRARKWTRWLIGLYVLSVVLTILAVYLVVALIYLVLTSGVAALLAAYERKLQRI